SSVRSHHGDLILLLRLHDGDNIDRTVVDDSAEPSRARNVADEHEIELQPGEELAHRIDRLFVVRSHLDERLMRKRSQMANVSEAAPAATAATRVKKANVVSRRSICNWPRM